MKKEQLELFRAPTLTREHKVLFNAKDILLATTATFAVPDIGNKLKLVQKWKSRIPNLINRDEPEIAPKFLATFFERILGYTFEDTEEEYYTLRELEKTDIGQKKPDAVLGIFSTTTSEVKAVIEFKAFNTPLDLRQSRESHLTPVEQAFQYCNKIAGVQWIIVSNFDEIRLYSRTKGEEYYEEFWVKDLDNQQELERFYYILCYGNLFRKTGTSTTESHLLARSAAEVKISSKFYNEYKNLRNELFQHLVSNNEGIDKITLLEKSQKILDRIIFIAFCEDIGGLLPHGLLGNNYEYAKRIPIHQVHPQQKQWFMLKQIFKSIDKGSEEPPITAYDGGLFEDDLILDNLAIDNVMVERLVKFEENYDFSSELDVNILGHIFEQSISDIEEIKERLIQTIILGKEKSRRKKEGIYYTPAYITKYIIANTVGQLLLEHPERLDDITILDPACGSGAFLNQAYSHLLKIHRAIHKPEVITLENIKVEQPQWFENHILTHNLYGVDLNEEPIEITKLSLWLKTAQIGQKLTNLNSNIKVGNSLVDDLDVVGNKSFNWKEKFPTVMKKGGFDVVIGNPPYINGIIMQKTNPIERKWLRDNYQYLEEKWDIYIAFIEKGLELLRDDGYLGFIIPDAFLTEKYANKIHEHLIRNYRIVQIDYFPNIQIFSGVGVHNIIIIIQKSEPHLPVKKVRHSNSLDNTEEVHVSSYSKIFTDFEESKTKLISKTKITLGDICFVSKGIVFNADEINYAGAFKKRDLISEKPSTIHSRKLIEGEDVADYSILNHRYVEWDTERVPSQLSRPTFPELHGKPKLVTNKIGTLHVALDTEGFVCDQTVRALVKWNGLSGVDNNSINMSLTKYSTYSREELENISADFDYYYLLALLNS
ncbi:MAG: N-6 DNA methylase, partial [Dehalococcoidia bacterium]